MTPPQSDTKNQSGNLAPLIPKGKTFHKDSIDMEALSDDDVVDHNIVERQLQVISEEINEHGEEEILVETTNGTLIRLTRRGSGKNPFDGDGKWIVRRVSKDIVPNMN